MSPRDGAQGFDIPLLIGGATTSRVHTAVKIDPHYKRAARRWVNDASRAVGVAQSLLSPDARGLCRRGARRIRRVANAHARARPRQAAVPLAKARANAHKLDWAPTTPPPKPRFLGTRVFDDYDLAELARTSTGRRSSRPGNWPGRYPAILDDENRSARRARTVRRRAGDAEEDHREKWFTAKA
jgi:5-methyltetrahydrofolate--homocysteine methyltransferase